MHSHFVNAQQVQWKSCLFLSLSLFQIGYLCFRGFTISHMSISFFLLVELGEERERVNFISETG